MVPGPSILQFMLSFLFYLWVMTFNLCGYRGDSFSSSVSSSVVEWPTCRNSRTSGRRWEWNCGQTSVIKEATLLNCMNNEQSNYRGALTDRALTSARRDIVQVFQNNVVDYQADGSQRAWSREWIHPCSSTESARFRAYGPMVRDNRNKSCRTLAVVV